MTEQDIHTEEFLTGLEERYFRLARLVGKGRRGKVVEALHHTTAQLSYVGFDHRIGELGEAAQKAPQKATPRKRR